MTKVYPKPAGSPKPELCDGEPATVLTVWRKSLLFNCNGFTVFDRKGNLVFRVDNYVSGKKGEIVLMDANGKSLLTIRQKKLSLGDHWMIYEGEESTNPKFSMKKHLSLLQSKTLAQMTPYAAGPNRRAYGVEGSYSRRCCAIYDERRRNLAEIKRKEAIGGVGLGVDVFRLVVQPGFDATVAMAMVILLEKMFRSRGPLIKF